MGMGHLDVRGCLEVRFDYRGTSCRFQSGGLQSNQPGPKHGYAVAEDRKSEVSKNLPVLSGAATAKVMIMEGEGCPCTNSGRLTLL